MRTCYFRTGLVCEIPANRGASIFDNNMKFQEREDLRNFEN